MIDAPVVNAGVSAFTVVFVEDDRGLAELTSDYLSAHGVIVHHEISGSRGMHAVLHHHPDVVLLDWMLPDLDGVTLCGQIRARSDVPIVMLTARDGELDRITGLERGADDYVVKPFSSPELLARLRAQVRRARGVLRPPDACVEVGPLRLDVSSREAWIDGAPVELTTFEFDLLVQMASRRGRVLTREQLLELVRGSADAVFDRAVDFHIANLRAKLGGRERGHKLIKTVRGVGYVLGWSRE